MENRTSELQSHGHAAHFRVVSFDHRPKSATHDHLNILVVTSQPLFRAALFWTLQRIGSECGLVEAACLSDAVVALRSGSFALVLLDEDPPECSALDAMKILKATFAVPVAMLSSDTSHTLAIDAIEFGACGFVQKSLPLEAIAAAVARLEDDQRAPRNKRPVGHEPSETDTPLTRAQVKVLILMEKGQLNKQIAYELGIAESTVKAHVSAIFRKLKVQNRVQAALVAHQQPGGSFRQRMALVGVGVAE